LNINGIWAFQNPTIGTYQRVKKYFFWPKLKLSVLEHVQTCEICQIAKGENVLSPGLLEPIAIPNQAWEVITMDFVTGLPKSQGKDVLMVIIDKLTKYCHLIALTHSFKAFDIAQIFLDHIYKLQGMPVKIITDRDLLFTSIFWKEMMGKLL
jgi:Integrase zinc binding domain